MKKSFIIYYDQSKMFKELSDEQAGKLIKCLLSNGDMSDIGDGMVRVAYASLITTIERDNIKYTQRCEKNRENANIRWNTTEFDGMQLHANACERIPANAKHADSDSDSDSDSENDNKKKNIKKKKNFVPPSENDVVSYFKEKGFTEAAAKKAYEYYDTANWHDSTGKKIKNWKQKMIAVWFKDENKESKYGW